MSKAPVTLREVLTRQVEEILPSRKGLESMMKTRKIRLYLGVDATSSHLHLGHTIVLRKLQQFQELGHEVILVFGTFTAQIGDPSGKDKAREPLTAKKIQENLVMYKQQAGKVLDLKKVKIKYNGDWLGKLNPEDFLKIASYFTVQQLLERDMFQRRMKQKGEVWVNEFLYPLLQGYDSVAMDVDLEVGATDQTFNMLVGRRLQKIYHQKEKFVLTTPLLLGLDGRKMSKTYGNTVNIMDTPQDMYGKLMSMKDELIPHYFELCTEVPPEETSGLAPREAKARLAREIVALWHGKGVSEKTEQEFNRVFQERQAPSEIQGFTMEQLPMSLSVTNLVFEIGFENSKSAARRLIEQGGIKIDGKTIKDPTAVVQARRGMVLQKGQRRFIEIV